MSFFSKKKENAIEWNRMESNGMQNFVEIFKYILNSLRDGMFISLLCLPFASLKKVSYMCEISSIKYN